MKHIHQRPDSRTEREPPPTLARFVRRRGFTIVELLMLISILSVILGISVIQIQLLMRLDQDGRARTEQSTNWERLGRQLRRDVHEARSAERFVEDDLSGLRIAPGNASSGRTIEYRVEPPRIVRVEQIKGQPAIRETYVFPRMVDAQFDIRAERAWKIVSLTVTSSKTRNPESPPRTDEILAVLGRETVSASSATKGADR